MFYNATHSSVTTIDVNLWRAFFREITIQTEFEESFQEANSKPIGFPQAILQLWLDSWTHESMRNN